MYCLGEGFVQTSVCEAEDKINEGEVHACMPHGISVPQCPLAELTPGMFDAAASEKAQEELADLKQQKEQVEAKMADLKKVLYGKFGREHINLEE